MRDLGLVAAQPRRKVRTTVPAEDLDDRPDLVKRDFSAPAPSVKWVGDITYIHTWTGARLPDNRSRLLHEEGRGLLHGQSYAHQPGVRRDQHGRAQPPPTLQAAAIFHSDRGSQYTLRSILRTST